MCICVRKEEKEEEKEEEEVKEEMGTQLCNLMRVRRTLRWMQHWPAKTIGGKIDVRKRRRTTNSSLPAK